MPPLELATVLDAERKIMNRLAPYAPTHPLLNSYYYRRERPKFVEAIVRAVRAAGRDPTDCSVLEVGVGAGDNLALLAAAGFRRLTGLDIAEEMLRQTREWVPSARTLHGSVEAHDFGAERFDLVLAMFTLHHMLDPGAFFRLVDRVLDPGGWFAIAEYNAQGWPNARWTRPLIDLTAAPLRRLIKLKNRRLLARDEPVPPEFNPAHRLLSFQQILDAMPNPQAYATQRTTHGLLLSAFNYALVEESAFDRAFAEVLDRVDGIVMPPHAGNLQLIIGQRL
jgi:ubiquinone/menaquinone biosynthesis C-methylase UbiE